MRQYPRSQLRLLVFFIGFLGLAVSAERKANAGFFQCLAKLMGPGDAVRGVSPAAMEHVDNINIGDLIRFRAGGGAREGLVRDVTFEHLAIEPSPTNPQAAPPAVEVIPHSRFRGIEILRRGLPETAAPELHRRLLQRRQYAQQQNRDFWPLIRQQVGKDIQNLRSLQGPHQKLQFLRGLGDGVLKSIREKYHVNNIGFHYNLNGGLGYQYVDRGGLRISRGDIALQYGQGSLEERVYFFQSRNTGLYDILAASNPKLIFNSGRMGSQLILFSLDNAFYSQAIQEGMITSQSDIYFDFDPEKLRRLPVNQFGQGMVGIPSFLFLAPPLTVFEGLSSRFRELGRLSRDEETLITMRYIEAVLMAPAEAMMESQSPQSQRW